MKEERKKDMPVYFSVLSKAVALTSSQGAVSCSFVIFSCLSKDTSWEPRMTLARTVPSTTTHSPAGGEHSRQCQHLVTGLHPQRPTQHVMHQGQRREKQERMKAKGRAGNKGTYHIAQAGTGRLTQGCHESLGPWEGMSWAKLLRDVKAYWCPQGLMSL